MDISPIRLLGYLLLPAIVVAIALYRHHIDKKTLRSYGLSPYPNFERDILFGLMSSLVAVNLLIGLRVLFGFTVFNYDFSTAKLIYALTGGLAGALLTGFLEELIFRGFLLQSVFLRFLPFSSALILTSVIFSITHFIGRQHGEYLPLIPRVVGLFVVGLFLGDTTRRTRSLLLSITFHSTWIFFLRLHRIFFINLQKSNTLWFNQDKTHLSDFCGWMAILIIALLLRRFQRPQDKIGPL